MSRISAVALSVALTSFVTTVSLALLSTYWFLETYILDEPTRSSSLKWFFVGLLMAGFNQANAQTATLDALVVIDAYPKQSNIQQAIAKATATSPDTLPLPAQMNARARERPISPKPAWPSDDRSVAEIPDEPDPASAFYLMAISHNPSVYKSGYWFRNRP